MIRITPYCRRSRRGYVLLATLVLIAIVGMSMAGMARRSFEVASACSDTQLDLQQRWGTVTLRRYVVGRGATIADFHWDLIPDGARFDRAPLPLYASVSLGKVKFELILSDENTKVNLNRLHTLGGKNQVLDILSNLTRAGSSVRLRPILPNGASFPRSTYPAWGHVFDFQRRSGSEGPPKRLITHTGDITCWGHGRLNFFRTSDAVLQVVAQPILGASDSRRLIAERRDNPDMDVRELVDQLGLRLNRRERLLDWFTSRSTCFGMWIIARTPQRDYYELVVAEARTNDRPRLTTFVW